MLNNGKLELLQEHILGEVKVQNHLGTLSAHRITSYTARTNYR